LEKIQSSHYEELSNSKKVQKFSERLKTLFDHYLVNKNSLEKIKTLQEFSLMLIIFIFSSKLTAAQTHFLPNNFLSQITSEVSLGNYFKLLLSHPLANNNSDFHMSYRLLLQVLVEQKKFELVINVWNTMIDLEQQKQFKIISTKNYQFLIFNFSKFILSNFFIFKYMKDIFDSSYFDNLLKFTSGKKFKFLTELIELLFNKLKHIQELKNEGDNSENLREYSMNLLEIFGPDPLFHLSPHSFKNFYHFLFQNLSLEDKEIYINKIINLEEDSVDSYNYKLSSLKELSLSGSLEEAIKTKILEFFFLQYLIPSEEINDSDEMIDEKIIQIILNNFKPVYNAEGVRIKSIGDVKVIKMLIKTHKFLQNLILKNKVNIDEGEYKIYLRYFKKFGACVKKFITNKKEQNGNHKELNGDINEENILSIVKLGFILLLLFLKNPSEYADLLSDLFQITNFDEDWMKVFTDIIISLFHKGNSKFIYFIL
jgi:hypothetical protein